jgi:hypothetical protein
MDLSTTARQLRGVTEPLAAGVYFAPEAIDGYAAAGLDYFEGYFCSRSACLGEAPWSVVCAAFAAFKPAAVKAAITTGWAKTDAPTMLATRLAGATAQLERILGDVADLDEVARATELLYELTDGVDPSGRILFSGLSVLPRPETPFGALWHAADLVREHRGDGHIAAWISHTDSTEITVLTELAWEIPPRTYVFTRGWDESDVDAAYARLTARGLIDGGRLTEAGMAVRDAIEVATDRANREVIERLDERADELIGLLAPWADAVVEAGGYPAATKNLSVKA